MRKKILLLVFILILLVTIIFTLAKFIFSVEKNNVIQAKEFYFTSDLLSEDSENIPEYNIYNWTPDSRIRFKLKNSVDENRFSTTDIDYKITATYMDDIVGILTNNNSAREEMIELQMDNIIFQNGVAQVIVNVKAISPYTKDLQAIFNIYEENQKNISYTILDAPNNPYLELVINSNSDKNIVLNWDKTKLFPDMTNSYINEIIDENTLNLQNVEEKQQIVILFYKLDETQNYSNNNEVIEINVL